MTLLFGSVLSGHSSAKRVAARAVENDFQQIEIPAMQTDSANQRVAVASKLPVERLAYTIDQAAAAVGLKRNTLRDRVSSGELPAVKRCGRWLIRRVDLERWLES